MYRTCKTTPDCCDKISDGKSTCDGWVENYCDKKALVYRKPGLGRAIFSVCGLAVGVSPEPVASCLAIWFGG